MSSFRALQGGREDSAPLAPFPSPRVSLVSKRGSRKPVRIRGAQIKQEISQKSQNLAMQHESGVQKIQTCQLCRVCALSVSHAPSSPEHLRRNVAQYLDVSNIKAYSTAMLPYPLISFALRPPASGPRPSIRALVQCDARNHPPAACTSFPARRGLAPK